LSDVSSAPAGHDEPLPLTVYALPVPDEAMREDSGRRVWQGRWKMIIVALVCAAPVIASYFTYYVIRPEGRRNHGELIDPLRPLPDLATTHLDGRPGNCVLKDQWLPAVAGGCDCLPAAPVPAAPAARSASARTRIGLTGSGSSLTMRPCPRPCVPPSAQATVLACRSGVAVARPSPGQRWRIICTWWTPRATG
jgi:hypothetical protein